MRFAKPALSIEEQADLLISRGMTGDRDTMVSRLSGVNYYRLSGYWHTFRLPDSDQFSAGTTFDKVWCRYIFDRRLRLLVLDAVERFEVFVRTNLAFEFACAFKSPFEYAEDPGALPQIRTGERDKFLELLKQETENSKETFVQHFQDKYGDTHEWLPVWAATEIMTFGNVLKMFSGAPSAIKSKIASKLGVHDVVLKSWMLSLNTVRNICAHHARLWNREFGFKPQIPKKDRRWHVPVPVECSRVFVMLTILKYCMDTIAPQSKWPKRLVVLLEEFPEIPMKSMGFPDNWKSSPIWSDC